MGEHARRPGPLAGYRASWRVIRDLHGPDCLSLRPAVALRDLEFDPLAFFEAAVAIRLDGREVHKHVPTTVDRDEAVALVRVEPFDGALSHYQQLPNSARASGCALATANPVDRGTTQRCGESCACRSRRADSDRTRLYNVACALVPSYSPKTANPDAPAMPRQCGAMSRRWRSPLVQIWQPGAPMERPAGPAAPGFRLTGPAAPGFRASAACDRRDD